MDTYPIRMTAQLRQHLRSLRRQRGLTQAQLGAQVGVSQARIAEIEANPGLVNVEQILQLLCVLGATLSIEVGQPSVGYDTLGSNATPLANAGPDNAQAPQRAAAKAKFKPLGDRRTNQGVAEAEEKTHQAKQKAVGARLDNVQRSGGPAGEARNALNMIIQSATNKQGSW